ncbi:MAG: SusC/RagA family TonB-linked outer membrane protein [Bacteroidota bacterium]
MRKFAMMLALLIFAGVQVVLAQTTITGTVTSSEDSKGIPGATVLVKGTNVGLTTDMSGRYSIKVPAQGKTLQFSFVGMKTKEVPIGNQTVINVVLDPDVMDIEGVVVTALGISRDKKSLGYAAEQVNAEVFEKASNINAMNSLQGKIPGLTVTSGGGNPSASTKVIIRGYSSVKGNNNVLYVVDGVPINNETRSDFTSGLDFGNRANDINPADIESMTILKGTAATSLYGPRGANGVIMVTTKSGSKDRFKVELNSSVTTSDILRLPQMQNTFGQGWSGLWAVDENGSWGPKMDGNIRAWGNVVDNSQKIKAFSPVDDNLYEFYDYGMQYTNSLSVSGGDEKSTYYLSYTNNSSDGIIPTDVDSYKKNMLRFNGTRESQNLKATVAFNYIRNDGSLVPDGYGGTNAAANLYSELLQIPRDFSIVEFMDYKNDPYNTLGEYFTPYAFNPYYALNENQSKFYENRYFGNVSLDYKVTSWLSATYRIGLDASDFNRKDWEAIMRFPINSTNNIKNVTENPGNVLEENRTTTEINQDFIFKTTNQVSDFTINGLVGYSTYQNDYKRLTGSINSLVIPYFYNLDNTDGSKLAQTYLSKKRTIGKFAIADIDYKDFVYLNLSARQESSSTLPKDANKFFYPSASISFLANEAIKPLGTYFNLLKIRASWGKAGNDAPVYAIDPVFASTVVYVPFYDPGLQFPLNEVGAFELGNIIGNAELKPEITTENEVGLDIRFLNNRVGIDFAYYNRITDKQIIAVTIPASSGFASQYINFGEVQNKGFELALMGKPIVNENFKWTINVNYSKNKNTVLDLPGDASEIVLTSAYDVELVAIEGRPLGIIRAPDYLRVDPNDPNSPVIVNASNGFPEATTEFTEIGSIQPDYVLGFTNSFNFLKDFDFSFTFDYRPGGYFYSGTADLQYFVGNATQSLYNDRQPFLFPNSVIENPYYDAEDPDSPQYIENNVAIDMTNNNAYYYHSQNAVANRERVLPRDFLKLRDISLSYTLPKKVAGKLKMQGIQLVLTGRDLFLWTPKENNFVDPESTSFGNDLTGAFGEFRTGPTVRSFTGSIRITL